MKKILVFMSTYNSGENLRAQIDSILAQKDVDVCLAIRDDGSKDGTCKILDEYDAKYPGKFQILHDGTNLGVGFAGKANVRRADKDGYDYYAFSDHDDVWMEDKLIAAVNMLDKLDPDKPALYYSNLAVTDKDLNYQFDVYGRNRIASTTGSCFVDFAASANTFVCNRKALDVFANGPKKDKFYGDVWFQFVIFFIGNVVYDDIPHLWFRRTGTNVSGSRDRGIALWINRLKKIKKESGDRNLHMHSDMAGYMLKCYGDQISEENKKILYTIAHCNDSIGARTRLLFSRKIRSKSTARNITFHGRLILNLL